MRNIAKFSAGLATLVAMAPITLAATAHADDGAVYFSERDHNCVILADGTVGCDRPPITMYWYYIIPVPYLQSPQVTITADSTLRDGFDYIGKPYTLPGGNPPFNQVANTTDANGFPSLEYAGRSCGLAGKGLFVCGDAHPGGGYDHPIIVIR